MRQNLNPGFAAFFYPPYRRRPAFSSEEAYEANSKVPIAWLCAGFCVNPYEKKRKRYFRHIVHFFMRKDKRFTQYLTGTKSSPKTSGHKQKHHRSCMGYYPHQRIPE